MKGVVRKTEAGLEQGLYVFKKQPAQKLDVVHRYAIWAWGFVGACFGEGRCNFSSVVEGGEDFSAGY
jgi:hypothetical protein